MQKIQIFTDAALQLSGNHLKWKSMESIALWSMILTARPGFHGCCSAAKCKVEEYGEHSVVVYDSYGQARLLTEM